MFAKFWLAQNASEFGTKLNAFVLPIIAVVALQATATQVSLIFVFQELAVVLLSLFVGVWMDRLPLLKTLRRTHLVQILLVAAGIGLFHVAPSLAALYAMALVLGIAKLILEVGHATLLPALVSRQELILGNSRVLLANSIIGSLAPTIGGALVRASAPVIALLGTVVSSLIATITLGKIPEFDEPNKATKRSNAFFAELRDGMRTLFENALLRPMTISSCAGAFAVGIYAALLIIVLSREIGLNTLNVGILVSVNSIAVALGSILSPRLSAKLGIGRGVILGNILTAGGFALLAVSCAEASAPLALLSLTVTGIGTSFYVVNQTSIRQSVTPKALMARVHASRRFVVFSFLPVGSLTGGLIADNVSVTASLMVATIGMTMAALITLLSPLRQRHLNLDAT